MTVGPTVRPRATAFRASRPAPTITVGFDVFVHDVMAAIATDPVRIVDAPAVDLDGDRPVVSLVDAAVAASRSSGTARRRGRRRRGERRRIAAPGTIRPTRPRPPPPSAAASTSASRDTVEPVGKFVRKLSRRSVRGTRSCGRRGPATDGSTVARSSSSRLVEVGPGARLPPQALLLRVALDEVDALRRSAGQPQVGERLVVDREDRRGRPELGAHVRDRRPVGEGETGQPVAGELDERADDAVRAQHLGHHEDEVRRGRAPRQLAVRRTPTIRGIGW